MARRPQDAVQFTLESAERIADVVRAAELATPQSRPLTFDAAPAAAKVKMIRAATFSGSWFTASSKVVTFANQPTATASVQNLTLVLPFTATQNCIVGKDGTAWYLVSAVDQQVKRGTFAAPWNKDANKTVSLASGQTVLATNYFVNIGGTGTKNCTVAREGTLWHLIAAECG